MNSIKSSFHIHFLILTILLTSHFLFASTTTKILSKTETPTQHQSFFGASGEWSGSRIWRAPNYAKQFQALGWEPMVFKPNADLRDRVQFWKDIYTKYSTHQGVIHHAREINKVYEVIDFKDIDFNSKLTDGEKERLREQRVENAKRKVIKSGVNKDFVRFQLGLKDRMKKAIYVSGRYIETMESIFAEEGLPIELTRLVFVESSFNVLARSKVGASGLWQIMPFTARPYGYLKHKSVDYRNHPYKATKLAAKLLKDNYRVLGDWSLAVTAYNHGATGMRRLTEKYKTKDLARLIKNVKSSPNFGFASRNFYASFLAALEVEKEAPDYFDTLVWSKPLDQKILNHEKPIDIERILTWFDGDSKRMQIFNPHFNLGVLKKTGNKVPQNIEIKVPADKYTTAIVDISFPRSRSLAASEKVRSEK